MTKRRTSPALGAVLLMVLSAGVAQAQLDDRLIGMAKANLRNVLGDRPGDAEMLNALRKTDDKALLPLLRAMGGSKDRLRRIFAALAVSQLSGAEANAFMRGLLKNDTDPAVQAAALRHLADHGAVTPEDLAAPLQSSDEALSLLAAREAVRLGLGGQAAATLKKLTASTSPELAELARMVALSADDYGQAVALNSVIASPRTPLPRKLRLLNLVETDAILAATPILQGVLAADPPAEQSLRTQAILALVAVAPEAGTEALLAEVGRIDDVYAQMQLLARLADQPDAAATLARLSDSPRPLVAAVARFELARRAGAPGELAEQIRTLLASGHPIVVDFVLRRAQADPVDAYVPALLGYIRSVPREAAHMQADHRRAASATVLLVKMSTPEAVAGLKQILGGRYNAVTRAAATGLIVAEGPALGELCLPLLESPYDELVTDATLAMGKSGDARAGGGLANILDHPDRYPPALLAIASWQALKVVGQAEAFVQELAAQVK